MTSAQLINQTSGNCEWFTPQPIIDAARAAMGGIDLDPASSWEANKRIRAYTFFGRISDSVWIDGLTQEWRGRVWMNHPFSREDNAKWIAKLDTEFASKNITAACCITYASTSEQWFQPLLKRPQCFLVPRTNFLLPNGKPKPGVQKGSVVTYFGQNLWAFYHAFKHLGVVKIRPGDLVQEPQE